MVGQIELGGVLEVEQEGLIGACAVFITGDGNVSIGDLVQIVKEILNAFEAALDTQTDCSSTWVGRGRCLICGIDHQNDNDDDGVDERSKSK